ncbi:putative aromatic peroxygenase [Mollisia scopiformis]|uniref:Putative aromatic peroxygenase n=1 Tax=Mollisia scopiformis TaxID=149040 RepID=A0A194XLT7_MOLSC|nr:putative aromatic peroxygenase [Mollisia scopiformis]KUJ21101.1 putative aromatic peroxygenase [Mollisia scopiformis]
MKSFLLYTALAAFPLTVSGFPRVAQEAALQLSRSVGAVPRSNGKRAVMFDPAAQLVDVTGAHAFTPPDFDAGDQRGPCPGLNALANHNYLPHDGVAAWIDIFNQTVSVYGLGEDIAAFLAVYGAIFDGSIVSLDPGYSIGGPTSLDENILEGLGILGTPQGLSGSHNKYESDASSCRYDLYTGGNDYKLISLNMFLKSVNENPQFFYAPFAGVIASTGGFSFPPRMMSNKSAEYPDNGILDKEVLKSFFSISGPDDDLTYTYGHEQIPANFYRRAIGNEYIFAEFLEDTAMFASYFPEMISIGGNTGTVDSYAAIDLGNLTGGVYEATTLLEGNNLACFVFESLLAAAPDVLKGGYSDPSGPMSTLLDNVNTLIGNYACPTIESLNEGQFADYPGAQTTSTGGGIL